ncbi:MAG: transposase [Deltaproteobacteria bacterium]|nr:transposase [Deltaproteobacteria bacterium]
MSNSEVNVRFSEWISQVVNRVRPQLLTIVKESLESSLLRLRDQRIGNERYGRNKPLKRYGFRIRKYITCTIGRLENVRIPRIRSIGQEVQLFADRYVHFSQELIEQVILGQSFLMSGRKMSIWLGRMVKDRISYSTLCKLMESIKSEIELIRTGANPTDIEALIVDGIWGRIRGEGKRVLLTALGVDSHGHIHILDWLVSKSESTQSWIRLFEKLRERGLGDVRLIVGDGGLGLPVASQAVYPESRFQICLWHLCRDLMRQVKGLNWVQRQRLYHDFWETFNAFTLDECYDRYLRFLKKWSRTDKTVERLFARYENNLFYYYDFPQEYNYRLRTVNLAEGFFSHLRTFLRKYPGWTSQEQVYLIMQIFLKGMKTYQNVFKSRQLSTINGTVIYAY